MRSAYHNKRPHKITGAIILVVVVGLLIFGGIYADKLEHFMSDLISNMRYSGSPEITEIADKLQLTSRGRFVFGSTNPAIEDYNEFNAHCNSHDRDTSMLGCYGNNKMYIYNVTAEELAGIKESTAAHELMHAVWDRMPESEKAELSGIILDEYNNGEAHERLQKELKNYDEDEIVDELHSRFATEVKKLPEKLEEHYAEYFADQDAVVTFYENYRAPFEKLESKFQELSDEMEEIKNEYDEKEAEYATRAEKFSRAADEFNSCAAELDCFPSKAAFDARHNELLAEQNALDEIYDELSAIVDRYNSKVDEYNSNVLSGEKLDNMMNSNKVEEIK
ncbi:hypothetical protein IJJ18_03075 [Candidatus Saccharibacteria bacterium]|nr:hypothetical protein [Candidatus Saccharibacteria bacterium]